MVIQLAHSNLQMIKPYIEAIQGYSVLKLEVWIVPRRRVTIPSLGTSLLNVITGMQQ